MPSLSKARESAKRVVCASQMKQFGVGIYMYALDNNQFPWYSKIDATGRTWVPPFWYEAINTYLGTAETSEKGARRCPTGKAWIGVHYYLLNVAGPTENLAPFCLETYGSFKSIPVKLEKIKHPSDWMLLMDTQQDKVYSPCYSTWYFNADVDGDGFKDSCNKFAPVPQLVNKYAYNMAMPKVHNNGSNVTLADGHVEWVRYKELWEVNNAGRVVHSFWYNDK